MQTRRISLALLPALLVTACAALAWFEAPRVAIDGLLLFAAPAARIRLLVALLAMCAALGFLRHLTRRHPKIQVVWSPPGESEHALIPSTAQDDAAIADMSARLRENFRRARRIVRSGGPLWRARRHSAYRLPWYVLVGDRENGPADLISASSLSFWDGDDGQAPRDDDPCRWWFGNDAVLLQPAVDTGSTQTGSSSLTIWRATMRHLRRTRRRYPVDGVIATLSATVLLDADEAVRTAYAKALRARIATMRSSFKANFPTYLVVTECGCLSGFETFVDRLKACDQSQPWGISLPLRCRDSLATLAEEVRALSRALRDSLVRRLVDEPDPSRCADIYDFPDEFEKLREPLMRFARDAFAPSPYASGILLRGIYFTATSHDFTIRAPSLDGHFGEARSDFAEPMRPDGVQSGYFIDGLLRDRIFCEARSLRGRLATMSRWTPLRYGFLASLVLATVLVATAWCISYRDNQRLIADTLHAVRSLANSARRGVDTAQPQSILLLLAKARRLSDGKAWHDSSTSWASGFGLYQGDRIHAAAVQKYRLFLRTTVEPYLVRRMTTVLQFGDLTDAEERYRALRAYLMMGDPRHADPADIAAWASDDMRTLALTTSQRSEMQAHIRSYFDSAVFSASIPLDAGLISQVRTTLIDYSLGQRLFESIHEQLRESLPGSLSVATMGGVNAALVLRRESGQPLTQGIEYAYTRAGYRQYLALRKAAIAKAARETWVLGQNQASVDSKWKNSLRASVDEQYFSHYAAAWQSLLGDVRLQPLPDLTDSAAYVRILAAADSPLRLFLRAAATQTTLVQAVSSVVPAERENDSSARFANTETTPVDVQFEPLHRLVMPSNGAVGPTPLDQVQVVLGQLAVQLDALEAAHERGLAAPPSDIIEQIKRRAAGTPDPLRTMLTSLAQGGQSLTMHNKYERLNELWRADYAGLCHEEIDGRYPIYPESTTDVTPDDFTRVFGRGGLLDVFFQANLAEYVDETTTPWRWRPDGQGHLSQASLDEFERAKEIRDAFFPAESKVAVVRFQLVPISMDSSLTRFRLQIDDQALDYEHGPQRVAGFQWFESNKVHTVRVDYESAPGDAAGFSLTGPWALFHLLDKGKFVKTRADRFALTLMAAGKPVVLQLNASSVVNPFALSALRRFRCPDGF